MKRHSEKNDGTDQLHLRKKILSRCSISTICEDENDSRPSATSSSSSKAASSRTSSGVAGINTMSVTEKVGEPMPQIFLQSPFKPSVPSVTPSTLSCNEEESEDEEDSSLTSSSSVALKPSCVVTDAVNNARENPLTPAILTSPTSEIANANKSIQNDQNDFRTGLVFEAGLQHFDRHSRMHKERPVRVTSIMEALKKNGIYARSIVMGEEDEEEEEGSDSSSSATTATEDKRTTAAAAFLEDDDYLRVHLPGYMKRLDKLFDCNCCREEHLDREAEQFNSIYFSKNSFIEAKKAATSLCSLVENVVQKDLDHGFAVIRPPGHHAEPGLAGGYCIINNVAVAAAYARAKLGVEKIMIVDWDVHHGNGTQSIFLNDPNVLYFSVHRWHGGNFFPFLSNGGPATVGMGDGVGKNINVGWTSRGMGDDEYLAVWDCLLMPVAREFQPELILVSAGFDAADGDLGECHITPECYGRLTRSLMTLETPIVCSLEGGYVRSILGRCVSSVVTALLDRNSAEQSKVEDDEDCRERGGTDVLDTIHETAATNIRATVAAHKSHWKCLADE